MKDEFILKKLSQTPSVSGYEVKASNYIADIFKEYTDDIKTDALGNLIGYKAGNGEGKIMLAAHMDEIGLMVTDIEEGGFLRFTTVGGVDQRTLIGQEVFVHAQNEDYHGVIGAKPPHIQSHEEAKKAFKLEDMYIDLGLTEDEVEKNIKIGDIISIKRDFISLENESVTGKALDDKAGIVMIIEVLKSLKKINHKVDCYTVATVQEEVGLRGATTSTYGIIPDIGVAIDVCHATMPGVSSNDAAKLGEGIAIGYGPHVHPQVFDKLKELAQRLEIPYQVEPSPSPGGTDAYAIQITRSGIATALLSIPLRYMHTSVEVISLKDIRRGARLLAHFISEIDSDFVEGLRCF